MTAQAVAERGPAGGPGVHARRRRMRPRSAVDTLPPGRRLVVLDASRLQAPGAPGTAQRRPSALDVWSWPCIEVEGSAVP